MEREEKNWTPTNQAHFLNMSLLIIQILGKNLSKAFLKLKNGMRERTWSNIKLGQTKFNNIKYMLL